MKWSFLDRSNYFKALLILMGIDGDLSDKEKEHFIDIGTHLGFNKKYINEVISSIFENDHITIEPIKFSSPEIAKIWLSDGIKFALADGEICNNEKHWLNLLSAANHIPNEWLNSKLDMYQTNENILTENFEIFNITDFDNH